MSRWDQYRCRRCGSHSFFTSCMCGGSKYDTDDEILDGQIKDAKNGDAGATLRALETLAKIARKP